MCQRCLQLQAARDRAEWRLEQKMREHGGDIPVGHPDIVFLRAVQEIDEACKASFRRHYHDTPSPTCIVCDRPATVLDEKRGAMVCQEHVPAANS